MASQIIIVFKTSFKKAYRKRILPNPKLDKKFEERYRIFFENPENPVLLDHPLKGKLKGYRSFSITGDIRVVYYLEGYIAYLVDIGTHNQVYK